MKGARKPLSAGLLVLTAGLCTGCANPLESESTAALRQSVVESARRELRQAQSDPDPRPLERSVTPLDIPADRMRELEQMAGPRANESTPANLGADLLGRSESLVVSINLHDALARAVRHNLQTQAARLQPAITEAQVVAAEAAFDWILFASVDATSVDEPTVVPVVNGVPVSSFINKRNAAAFETGVRKPLSSGGTLQIRQGLSVNNNQTPFVESFPDPARRASLDITLGQPLLRGFGSDAALEEVYLARNAERDSIQGLRQEVIDVITGCERAYWSLAFARSNLLIRERLLERGVQTRDVLKGRLDFDVKPAEYSDAVARVYSRQGDVIRAANLVRQRSDELKAIINDPLMPVGDETVLTPLDPPVDAPIIFSLLDSLATALSRRPDVQRAVIQIDDAGVRQRAADNARLPMLDLTMQAAFAGLADDVGDAYEDIGEAQFVNFLLGLAFEVPIGNRGPEAVARQRRLERIQAAVLYRAAVQSAVLEVKTALRNVKTNYQLIEQTRASRLAAAENLRTLLVEEENIRALTPDFLDLKFRRQEALAQAELEEIQALSDYNVSLADYYAAMGAALERNGIDFVVEEPSQE